MQFSATFLTNLIVIWVFLMDVASLDWGLQTFQALLNFGRMKCGYSKMMKKIVVVEVYLRVMDSLIQGTLVTESKTPHNGLDVYFSAASHKCHTLL